MIYPKIKNEGKKTAVIRDFSGGIDKNALDGNNIKYCENLILKDGSLVTRPGLGVCEGYTQTGEEDGTSRLKITNLTHYINGKKYKLAYYFDANSGRYNCIKVYLVSGNNDILSFGHLELSKQEGDADGTVYMPKTSVFYSGTKTKGCGIYALVGYTTESGDWRYGVFEAADIIDSPWIEIPEIDRYIPTVLINGKGTEYDRAKETYNLKFDDASSPEKANIITPYVKAYFTTDGYSSAFYMPDQYYDVRPVKCIVYNTTSFRYEFEIQPGNYAEVNMYGKDYKVYFNRLIGMLYFTDAETGGNRSLPRGTFYKENNVVLIASKSGRTDPTSVLSCNDVVTFNSRAYLYKSKTVPNGIYSCKVTNPLYFPTNMQTLVGSDIDKITGAGYQNDKLIVFKEGETFKVNTTTAENEIKFLSPEMDVRFTIDSLSNESISTKTGCMNGATVASCAGQLIWLGSDKKVYTLEATTYGSEKNVFSISEKVDHLLEQFIGTNENPFACVKDGYYYLFCGCYVFICDCHITNMGYAVRYGARNMRNVSWYLWKLPESHLESGKTCDEIMLTVSKGSKNGFMHFLPDYIDTVFDFESISEAVKTIEIPIKLETADYLLGTEKEKTIEKIEVNVEAEPCNLEIITDNRRQVRHIHSIKNKVLIRNLINALKGTRKAALKLNTSGKFALHSISVDYKAVN